MSTLSQLSAMHLLGHMPLRAEISCYPKMQLIYCPLTYVKSKLNLYSIWWSLGVRKDFWYACVLVFIVSLLALISQLKNRNLILQHIAPRWKTFTAFSKIQFTSKKKWRSTVLIPVFCYRYLLLFLCSPIIFQFSIDYLTEDNDKKNYYPMFNSPYA